MSNTPDKNQTLKHLCQTAIWMYLVLMIAAVPTAMFYFLENHSFSAFVSTVFTVLVLLKMRPKDEKGKPKGCGCNESKPVE